MNDSIIETLQRDETYFGIDSGAEKPIQYPCDNNLCTKL